MDESLLHQQAGEAIQSGKLPKTSPDRTWGGPGENLPCSICGKIVGKDEKEFEIHFLRDGDATHADVHHLHIRCFAAWEFERAKPEAQR